MPVDEPPSHKREFKETRVGVYWKRLLRMSNFVTSMSTYKPETPILTRRHQKYPARKPKLPNTKFSCSTIILLVIEMKFAHKRARDCYAQVLLLVCETFPFTTPHLITLTLNPPCRCAVGPPQLLFSIL